jgi:NADH:ubiquinone oxidoreductase subunit 2 (subunit N)
MYFEKPDSDVCLEISKQAKITLTINGLLILFLGIFPGVMIGYLGLF